MASPLNPYANPQAQRRNMGVYAGGYGRYNPNTDAAVTGPVGNSSGANPEAEAMGREEMLEQQRRQQEATANIAKQRQQQTERGLADQAKNIAAYRQARDNSQGAVNAREQTQESRFLGIDPSSSPTDIAAAASGKVGFDANGLPTGGTTSQAIRPNEADVRNAVVTQQAAKNGAQAVQQATAYANGATSATGQTPTGINPLQPRTAFTATLRPSTNGAAATSAPSVNVDADAQRKAEAMTNYSQPSAFPPAAPSVATPIQPRPNPATMNPAMTKPPAIVSPMSRPPSPSPLMAGISPLSVQRKPKQRIGVSTFTGTP